MKQSKTTKKLFSFMSNLQTYYHQRHLLDKTAYVQIARYLIHRSLECRLVFVTDISASQCPVAMEMSDSCNKRNHFFHNRWNEIACKISFPRGEN